MFRPAVFAVVLCAVSDVHAQPTGEEVALDPWLQTNDCVGSVECEDNGLCHRLGEQCVALSHDDCVQSLGCRTAERCWAQSGHCMARSSERKRYSRSLMISGFVNIGVGALSIVGCFAFPVFGPACGFVPLPPAGYIGSLTTFSVLLNAGIVMAAVGGVRVDGPGDDVAIRIDASGIAFDF